MKTTSITDSRLAEMLDISFLCHDWIDKTCGLNSREADPMRDKPSTLAQLKCGGFIQRYPEGICMKDLAAHMGVTPGAMTQMVETFVKAGLAERFMKPDNRRSVYVRMSKRGIALHQSRYLQFKKICKPLFQDIAAADLQTFFCVLDQLSERLFSKLEEAVTANSKKA